MKRMVLFLSIAAMLVGGNVDAKAAGVNGIYDVLVAALTADKATFTDEADVKRIDDAIAALSAAPTELEKITANVTALQKAVTKLGPLAGDPAILPDLDAARNPGLWAHVAGRGNTAGAKVSLWLQTHTSLGQQFTAGKTMQKLALQNNALGTVNGDSTKTLKQKLKKFLKICKYFDSVHKKYG